MIKCFCCGIEYEAGKPNMKGFIRCPGCGVFFNAMTQCKVEMRKGVLEGSKLKAALVNNKEKFISLFDLVLEPILEERLNSLSVLEGLNLIREGRKLFDVCCGIGGSLRLALDRGWSSVLGCDLNAGHCKIAKEHYGVDVLCTDVEDLNSSFNATFDLVMSFHGIEHVRNPYMALRKMLDLSKGIVYLEHPCVSSVVDMEKGGHVHEWSFKSFSKLVARLGVESEGKQNDKTQSWILFKDL